MVTQKLQGTQGPVVAVSDWMRAVQDQIREWVPGDYGSLGADGFGFSDTRPAARRVFHIDGPSMAAKALQMLADQGKVPPTPSPGRSRSTSCTMSRPARRATRAATPDLHQPCH